ncbi:PQQ-dependent sugar dehydrogenase [Botrimarina mediterranea]|uniref:Soluble aldose sugar dehydrogenase YliI n=1 Tax=Botrimarina mediterranea TaxID=2528022 RepID=A0A518K5U1_9BACT|nr:PQQ-dependent sugar dehydrogenase [Botrimarina mediterranea]QDV73160.1 Soluble aldose sugar dehydrogenase YliI precursor [Botrimarina mediterranea]QDV77733.1 Soluble aldose sugar dehydrogenase YliI precursor [Planctomycetes bacterium K2D]
MIRSIHRHRTLRAVTTLAAFQLVGLTPSAKAALTGATLIGNTGTSITAIPDPTDPGRLLVAGRSGRINAIDLTTGAVSPYITFPGVSTSGEGGLLGIALDADYATNGVGYAYYTSSGTAGSALTSRIVRFTRDPDNPDRGLSSSITPMLSVAQPQNNHNGGWIGVSPNDGLLYIALGDGGGSNDTGTGHTSGTGNAQDITNNLLGKILRIDPHGDDFPTDDARNYSIPSDNPFVGNAGDDEIWSFGLRNPFRNSFDRETGDLWIADVGQNVREEINFQSASSAGGENYGWRLREGTIATPSGGVGGPAPRGATDPIYEYTHGFGSMQGNSITGGYVYRGEDASLDGTYFFADFVSSNYWARSPEGVVTNVNSQLFPEGAPSSPVSFAEDLQGNLYVLTIGGDLYRIDTTMPGDYNGDGVVNTADYDVWATAYGSSEMLDADGNGDGVVDAADYTIWRDNASSSPSAAVPEPSSLMLVFSLAAASTSLRRPPAAKK